MDNTSNKLNSVSVDSWVDHFSSLNKKDPTSLCPDDQNVIYVLKELEESLKANKHVQCKILDKSFTLQEILNGIKKLKTGKASGYDIVSNDLIKATANIIAPLLLCLFNNILSSEYVPSQWGIGIIIPLFKSGEHSDPNNYRGISINSCISKLFTLLLNDRLAECVDTNNSLHFNQIGFRKGYRPADHVLTLKTLVDQAFAAKKDLYVCFVDFKKAYDTVWRDGLFLKLLKNNVSCKFVNVIKSMYSSLKACVQVPGGLSSTFPSLVGLKQGCNLSPLLFNLFINDLMPLLNESQCDAPFLGDYMINCLLYADDLVLISETKEGLQELMNKLHNFSQTWFLEVNTSKTKSLIFSKKRAIPNISFSLGDILLPTCDTYCYLGTMFSQNGSFKEAANVLYEKALKSMFSLVRSIYKFRRCSLEIMLKLFDSLTLPIALYGSEVWGPQCFYTNPKNDLFLKDKPNISTLKLQYKFLKIILGVGEKTSNWAVLTETGRYPLCIKIMINMLKYWRHLAMSTSPILRATLQTNINLSLCGVKTWFTYVKRMLVFLDIEHILYTADLKEISFQIGKLKRTILNKFHDSWKNDANELKAKGGKLDFYTSHKKDFSFSKYLTACSNPKYRLAITRMRICAHKYPIETGRYINLDKHERICPFCVNGVGDEKHYLTICDNPIFDGLRRQCFNNVEKINPQFKDLNDEGKISFLMTTEEPEILKDLGHMLSKIEDIFKESKPPS